MLETTENRKMVTAPWFVFVALFALFSLGCSNDEVESRVQEWLRCDECLNGELNAVLADGNRAVSSLAASLRGPSPSRLDSIRTRLGARYDRILASSTTPLPEPRDAYIDRFVQSYVSSTQVRSAVALDSIGTRRALNTIRAAYDDAIAGTLVYSPSVFSRIAAIHMGNPPAGSVPIVKPDSGSFGDTITVSPGTGITWTGTTETFTLDGDPMWIVERTADSARLLVPSTFVGLNALIVEHQGTANARGSIAFDVRSVFVNPGSGSPFPGSRFFVSLDPSAPSVTYRVCPPPTGSYGVSLGWQTGSRLGIVVTRLNGAVTDSLKSNSSIGSFNFVIAAGPPPASCRNVAFVLVSGSKTMAKVTVSAP